MVLPVISFGSEPQRLCEISLSVSPLLGFPSPFVLFPAAIKVADEQPAQCLIEMRLGIVRPQGERAVVARQRLLEPLQLLQGDAAIGERLGIVRPQRERAVVARQRLLEPLQLMQGEPRLESASA